MTKAIWADKNKYKIRIRHWQKNNINETHKNCDENKEKSKANKDHFLCKKGNKAICTGGTWLRVLRVYCKHG